MSNKQSNFLGSEVALTEPETNRIVKAQSIITGLPSEGSSCETCNSTGSGHLPDPETIRLSPLLRAADAVNQPVIAKLFPDGTLIETVRHPESHGVVRLLVYKDQKATFVDQFQRNGDIFVPKRIDSTLLPYLRISTGINLIAQPAELLADLVAVMHEYVDLSDDLLHAIGVFVLCSWFPDRLPVAPYLWLVGPLASGKTTILKLLQALCRRALLVGDLTPASLYQLPMLLDPTLLIDENDRFLRVGNTRGALVIRNGRGFDPYCVKVLASREPPSDAALSSRSFIIGTCPSNRSVAPLYAETIERIALEFQPKLLGFRLQNFQKLHVSGAFSDQIASMTPRIKDIARALAIPLLGNVELETTLVNALEQEDMEARVQQSIEPEWLVVEALFFLCHRDDARPNRSLFGNSAVLVGGVAETINRRMSDHGEDVRLTARRTGAILRALGIRTKKLGKLGRGIELTPAAREMVHKLSRQFGFTRRSLLTLVGDDPVYGGAPCWFCEKFGLTAGLKFVPVRDWEPAHLSSAQQSRAKKDSGPMSSKTS
jgi:hypothetical protein